MNQYFNIKLEFNPEAVHSQIKKAIESEEKGYVCVVDGNVLAVANKDENYRLIVNRSTVNICDGSSIAILAGWIHKTHFSTYTGPELFDEYVNKNYKQYFLGNTAENLERLKSRFTALNYNIDNFRFESLPFKKVEDFDYNSIADDINEFQPDIIWVSLGAPKQERFISRLLPYINKGIMFAIGAAFNLYIGDAENKRAPLFLRKLHLEWLYRVLLEPQRVGKRALNYLIIIPRLIINERKNK